MKGAKQPKHHAAPPQAVTDAVRASRAEAYANGRLAGYAAGTKHGFHYGMSQSVISRYRAEPGTPKHSVRVLYVTTGKGFPYSPIDEAVIASLQEGVAAFSATPPDSNIAAAVKKFKPDLLLVMEGMRLPAEQAIAVREKGVRTAVWFTDDPYYTDHTAGIAPYYEFVFTLEINCVPFYSSLGCKKVFYLPLGANPNVFQPYRVDNGYRRDVSFIGSAYWNRVAFFDSIAPALIDKQAFISGLWWDRLKSYRQLMDKIGLNHWMTPEETAKYYFGSSVVINLHRAHDDESYNHNSRKLPAMSVNPRTFEIAASGAFQLTDERQDLRNMYEIGKEIVTYDSPEDLLAKMNYYMEHEEERREIAVRGLARTLRDHTYRKRLDTMLNIVFGQFEQGGVPEA
ncbi:CgeB family protein [Paenibacillus cymbidii]|uniref:CgeB family protein n=1 Tax=Paenibacillus cymbidii TaxID=1639034 RepID=UPI001080623F|nr:glycosyltransferase [Paenibacillus cymbidii]